MGTPNVVDPWKLPYLSQGPRVIVVVDTNALLSSIAHDCSRGQRSRLRKMAGWSTQLYASGHVFREMYRRLPKLVKSEPGGPTLADLRACLEEEYLPLIRFVKVTDDGDVDTITDPDDKPTGRLANLIGPCLVFSDDKHLKNPGYAPANWRVPAGTATEVANNDQLLIATTSLPALPPIAAHLALKGIAKWLETSTVAMYGVASLVAGLYLSDDDRRSKLTTRLSKAFDIFGTMLEQVITAQEAALSQLQEHLYRPTGPRTLTQQVASVLAHSRRPITAEEVQDRVDGAALPSGQPSLDEVLEVLQARSEFIAIIDGPDTLWQLGAISRPWPGRYPIS